MSDLMFYGVLRMPYEMAMSDELSRRQFWSRAQEAADRVEVAEAELSRRAAQPADVGAKQVPTNPMCERKTNDIIQREGYQKTGYVLMKDDPAARICVSDQGAVSWFTREQWNWLMHNRDHVEFQWPKPLGTRLSEASPQAAQEVIWSADAPAEQGWYWHWSGNPDDAPFPLSVLWSGTAKKCFVTLNQTSSGNAEWCDEYGGYWTPVVEPRIPETLPKKGKSK